MAWSPAVLAPSRVRGRGWFPDLHAASPGPAQQGWWPIAQRLTREMGVGADAADLLSLLDGRELGVGADAAVLRAWQSAEHTIGADRARPGVRAGERGAGADRARIGVLARELGVGGDLAAVLPLLAARELGVGADRGGVQARHSAETAIGGDWARPGAFGRESGRGVDLATQQCHTAGRDPALGGDRHLMVPKLATREASIGRDHADSRFPLLAADARTYTASASGIDIPYWCRYVDVIGVGAGGGGNSGNNTGSAGDGGNGGIWGWWVFERGVHIPWTAITINVTVGAGGGNRANGTASTIYVEGWGTLSCAGGTWRDSRGNARDGRRPSGGNTNNDSGLMTGVLLNGVTYAGGGWATGDDAPAPGTGGRGGGGSIWPLSPGSGRPGARGQVWLRFWAI